tara:strand:- start:356 stop:586 length:231 start_codon:yes stop_codon:yes gene_type:complete
MEKQNLQLAPEGFVLGTITLHAGTADWAIEHKPAWIRETETGADAILIHRNGDYSGLYKRVRHGEYTLIKQEDEQQ